MERQIVFKAQGICKSFPGVKALNDVSFELYSGEVYALLGENGAGKSTLIKVMSGIYRPEKGSLEMDQKIIAFSTPRSAFDAGICVVHQELNYISELTVAENIMMSKHPVNKFGIVDWQKMFEDSQTVLEKIGLNIDPKRIMSSCTVAEKQQIEIAKALYWNAKILILDEPTSALNNVEIDNLMNYLHVVKKSGAAIVFISHKLEEIFKIADRVGVLRDGEYIKTLNVSETNADELIGLMVGRKISDMYPKQNSQWGEEILTVSNLQNSRLRKISFNLKRGEILGVYGLMGSGHTDLGEMLFGVRPPNSGKIQLNGKTIHIRSPYDALINGMAYVPSERKTEGLVLIQTVLENIVTVHYQKEKHALINAEYEKQAGENWISRFRIKTPSSQTIVGSLSGGNQQKVVLAKWMEIKPDVLIMVDPTRGIDVGSKAEIYSLLDQFCAQGISIIMITSEMAELLAMSDRVLVMHEGEINGEFTREELSQVKVVSAAIGGNVS